MVDDQRSRVRTDIDDALSSIVDYQGVLHGDFVAEREVDADNRYLRVRTEKTFTSRRTRPTAPRSRRRGSCRLVALADNAQGRLVAGAVEVGDVCPAGLGDAQTVETEKTYQCVARAAPGLGGCEDVDELAALADTAETIPAHLDAQKVA